MYYLNDIANFARTPGAKDKKPRKKRGSGLMATLAGGATGGIAGGIYGKRTAYDASKNYYNKEYEKISPELKRIGKKTYDELLEEKTKINEKLQKSLNSLDAEEQSLLREYPEKKDEIIQGIQKRKNLRNYQAQIKSKDAIQKAVIRDTKAKARITDPIMKKADKIMKNNPRNKALLGAALGGAVSYGGYKLAKKLLKRRNKDN